MIQIQSIEQMSRATENAKKSRLFVQQTGINRQYRVTNRTNGHQYTIDFFLRNGKRFGHCTCKAGMSNKECKHLAASLGLHLYVASVRYSETSHWISVNCRNWTSAQTGSVHWLVTPPVLMMTSQLRGPTKQRRRIDEARPAIAVWLQQKFYAIKLRNKNT